MSTKILTLTQDDADLVIFLAGGSGCSLDSSPKENWVERSGGLPNYICKIAKAVMRSGKSKSSAIAIAVSRVKKWAAGGDNVDADTKAKAAKALAAWEALKAKNKSKKIVKASREDGSEYLVLSNTNSFNTDIVRRAYDDLQRSARKAARQAMKAQNPEGYEESIVVDEIPYNYIRELWTDHIIVESEVYGSNPKYVKIPYEVNGSVVTFHDPQEVEQVWQEVDDGLDDDDLNEIEKILLGDVISLSAGRKSYLEVIQAIARK